MAASGSDLPRREFLAKSAVSFAALVAGSTVTLSAAVDSGSVTDGKIKLPNEKAKTDTPEGSVPTPIAPDARVGFAVVGLGRLALEEILPAFGASKKAKLVALVSGSAEKAAITAHAYGVKPTSIYTYDNFDSIRDNPEIQAVYIVLPNALHAPYVLRAAKAGKHVLCEKPMATSVVEAQQMIDGCKAAGVKLMIAYRCQYEPYNRIVIDMVGAKKLGPVGLIEACNTQNQADIGQWRLKKHLSGGGSLPDVGLYCLNSARAVLNEEPIEVFATTFSPPGDPRFDEVEATVSFVLRFPSGAIANCTSSYALHESRQMRVHGPEGDLYLANAFGYEGQELTEIHQEGRVTTATRQTIPVKNQFALELDHMADCITRDITPHTPGEEGLQDHRVMEAIYESVRIGAPVKLTPPGFATRGPDPA